MEIALRDDIPSFSGGLGVLAGDHLRAAADLGIGMVGVTLLYRQGYFRQHIDDTGRQREEPVAWIPEAVLDPLNVKAIVRIGGRDVALRPWRFVVHGAGGHAVPVLLLDTDLDVNDERDRVITDQLYGGDLDHRLRQEAVLGLGGMAVLDELGWGQVHTLHMNEGHSALLTVAALGDRLGPNQEPSPETVSAVRARCVFTTHTPVPAGHDRFPEETVRAVLGDPFTSDVARLGCLDGGELNMTHLGMFFSRFVNAVSVRHGEVSRAMFPGQPIRSVTNGVHAATWTAPSVAELFDRHLEGWRANNAMLRSGLALPIDELHTAHQDAKQRLIDLVAERTGVGLDPGAFTLGIARRAATYKRLDLLLREPERLRQVAERIGPLQIVYGGKAHPRDDPGKDAIGRVHDRARALDGSVGFVYLEDYALDVAKVLCAGADLWVNTPIRPYEASGTSGMKAALNGVPSLSVLDGWWVEGGFEGLTGWSVGDDSDAVDDEADAHELYDKLERVITPLFFERPSSYWEVGRSAIALNGSYFTTERMVRDYTTLAYGTEVCPP
jgi:starch phosphorylase